MPTFTQHLTEGQQVENALADSDRPFDAEAEEPLAAPEGADGTSTRDRFAYTTFSRMPNTWLGDDLQAIERIDALAAKIVNDELAGAIAMVRRMRRAVRTPRVRPGGSGEILMSGGEPVWELDEDGMPVEDWSLLGIEDQKNYLFTITTNLVDWKRKQAVLWRRAMIAKAMWEEMFAKAFHAMPGVAISGKPTVPDKTQIAHSFSIQQRYFAVLQSSISREADAVIRAVEVLQTMLLRTVTS